MINKVQNTTELTIGEGQKNRILPQNTNVANSSLNYETQSLQEEVDAFQSSSIQDSPDQIWFEQEYIDNNNFQQLNILRGINSNLNCYTNKKITTLIQKDSEQYNQSILDLNKSASHSQLLKDVKSSSNHVEIKEDNCENKEWSLEYFEQVNANQQIDQRFLNQKTQIFQKLKEKQYYLCQYLTSGGQGIIFKGYKYTSEGKKEDVIFKVVLESKILNLEEEIHIMYLLEENINVITLIDYIQEQKFFILVLEECQYSLNDELKMLQVEQIAFTKSKLFQMILDLIDGLIQFRIYNILHLDIKPENILVNYSGNYIYTDFGLSTIKKNNQTAIKGYTSEYASQEQLEYNGHINYKSDVYSLGKTIRQIISVYKKVNHEGGDTINTFEKIISQYMVQNCQFSRQKCLFLHEKFFQAIVTEASIDFLYKYQQKIKQIINLLPYDDNKDFMFVLKVKQHYSLTQLNLTTILTRNSVDISNELINVGICYLNIGDYKMALWYFDKSLEMRRQIYQGDNNLIAESLNYIGICQSKLNNQEQAQKQTKESLEMRQKIYQGYDITVAKNLCNYGLICNELGELENSLKFQKESLFMLQQIMYQENNSFIAASYNNVGLSYYNLGDSENSLLYLLKSLDIRKSILNKNHPEIAESLINLGFYYINEGQYQRGLEYHQEALQIRQNIYKRKHILKAESLYYVGICYSKLKQFKVALPYYLESYQIFQKLLKNEYNRKFADILYNLGLCYFHQHQFEDALQYFQKSLEINQQLFTGNNLEIANCYYYIGICFQNKGEEKEALKYCFKSLFMRKKVYKTINHQNKVQNSEESFKIINKNYDLKVFLKIEKGDITKTTQKLFNIGEKQFFMQNYQCALIQFLEFLKIIKQSDDRSNEQIEQSLNYIRLCCQNLGDTQNVLNMKKINLRGDLDIANLFYQLSKYYQRIGDLYNALEFSKKSLQMEKEIQNNESESRLKSLFNIIDIYFQLGDYQNMMSYAKQYQIMRESLEKQKIAEERSLNKYSLSSFLGGGFGEARKNLQLKEKDGFISNNQIHGSGDSYILENKQFGIKDQQNHLWNELEIRQQKYIKNQDINYLKIYQIF